MTVKLLTPVQKEAVVTVYLSRTRTIKEIAGFLKVSERTIGRVLKQKGVSTVKPLKTVEAPKIMPMYDLEVDRPKFEQFMSCSSGDVSRADNGDYISTVTHLAWTSWQEARNTAWNEYMEYVTKHVDSKDISKQIERAMRPVTYQDLMLGGFEE